MKVNLLLGNPGDIRSGFLNIDAIDSPQDCQNDGRIAGAIDDLQHSVNANEVEELIAMDILDYFQMDRADEVLRHWMSRIAHGGKITISVVDIRQISRELLAGNLDIADANELLFGAQEHAWQIKRCAFSLQILLNAFTSNGFHIERKQTSNNRLLVTARRP